jgi:hypothetical protein
MRGLLSAAAVAVVLPVAASAGGPSFVEVDVSQLRGSQAEVAIAADPANPDNLLAASNSIDFSSLRSLDNLMRTYTTVDGGTTWKVGDGPVATPYKGRKRCNSGDPAPAIDTTGREYLAFLASACVTLKTLFQDDKEFDLARLEVASRPNASAPWRVSQVYPVRSARFDDKPAIVVDNAPQSPHLGRVYVAWTRITPGSKHASPSFLIVASHSDDAGLSWSRPVVVADSRTDEDTFATLGVDAAGTVFVAWTTITRRLFVDRSTDGGDHFGRDVTVGEAAGVPGDFDAQCEEPGSFGIPAESLRCITPDPTLQVDSRPGVPERVYVTYSTPDTAGRAQDVVVRAFDATLQPLGAERLVHAADLRRDEFLPASALDETGTLWVCFYDTGADRTRRTARFTCTASADGGLTWAAPRAVASIASDENDNRAESFQYGDYEGLAVAGGVAHPIWTDGRDLRARGEEIYTTTLTFADLSQAP